jgi:endoglucanase
MTNRLTPPARHVPCRTTPLRAAAALGALLALCAHGGHAAPNDSAKPLSSPCSAAATENLSIRVCGNRLVDAKGAAVQVRGVNVAGLEGVAIQGWDPGNPWGDIHGGPMPNWKAIKEWGANAVRLPINEASWLELTCVDRGGAGSIMAGGEKRSNRPGQSVRADPGGNYRATVQKSVVQATAAGLYVIVDLHLSAPGNSCPNAQNAMADADHAIAFWSSLANALKGYPNVVFELFNEPFLDQAPLEGATPWEALLNGAGTIRAYKVQGNPGTVNEPWHPAGMQQMLEAVRATGASNVILTSTLAYSSAMEGWLQYHPKDSLNPSQVGAVWHAYPADGHPNQANCIGLPSCSARVMASVQAILAAGYPVVITEFGDAVGRSQAPFASVLLPFADSNEIGYLGWTWDPWIGTSYYLITDAAGHPTAGYGEYVKRHYLCRAGGMSNCP